MKIGFVAMCLALTSVAIQIKEDAQNPADLAQGDTQAEGENVMLAPLMAYGMAKMMNGGCCGCGGCGGGCGCGMGGMGGMGGGYMPNMHTLSSKQQQRGVNAAERAAHYIKREAIEHIAGHHAETLKAKQDQAAAAGQMPM